MTIDDSVVTVCIGITPNFLQTGEFSAGVAEGLRRACSPLHGFRPLGDA